MDFNITDYKQTHTFSERADTYFTAKYFLVRTRIHTHTHTHTRKYNFTTFFFCLDGEHSYTQICSNNTHYHSAKIWNIHTHIYI